MNEGALHELPGGWVWTITSEVCSSVRDGTHDTPKYVEKGVPLITSKNLKENSLDFSTAKNISIEDHEKISLRSGVDNGDVLFAMIGTIGNPVVVKTKQIFSIKNVALFKKNEKSINSQYLKWWLSSWVFDTFLERNMFLKGTTQKFIPLGSLRTLPIPFPPLPEQRAIVSKIEQLFSDLDNGIENFKKAQAQLNLYHRSVLNAACEGKLVPTEAELARAQGCDYEAADVLLARILKERRAKWEADLCAKGKDPKKAKYVEIQLLNIDVLPLLPKSWIWVPWEGNELKNIEQG
jgi:type I restriction enzyme S subunit